MRKILQISLATCFTFVFSPASYAEDAVGSVVFAIGKVVATSAKGEERTLKRRDDLFNGDTIVTSSKSQAQIRMIDDAFVSVKPDTVFKIDNYRMAGKTAAADASEFELIRGGFRAITGQIGKRNQNVYRVKTPVATLGVRGTDYVAMLCKDDCAQRDENVKASANSAANGLYVGVIDGSVRMANSVGAILLERNQFGFVDPISGFSSALPSPPQFLLFDRTVMPVKEVRELRRSLGSQIAATVKRNNEERPSRPDRATEIASNAASSARDNVAGKVNSFAANNNFSIQTMTGKVGSFLSGQNLGDLNETISDAFDNSMLNEISSDPAIANLDTTITAFGGSTDTSKTNLVSTNPDTLLTPPWLAGYNQYTLPPVRVLLLSSPVNGLSNGVTPWAGFVNEQSLALGPDGNPTSVAFSAATNSTTTINASNAIINDFGYDANTQVMWGRWSNGSLSVATDGTNNFTGTVSDANATHWIMSAYTPEVRLPITGSATYQLYANTSPTDNYGNVGSLGSATLQTNFDAQTAKADLQVNINSQTWSATGSDIPIKSPNFSTNNLTVNVSAGGANVAGTGSLSGSFYAGQKNITGVPDAAGIVYRLDATPNAAPTNVNGAAVLQVQP